jgi:hypothetical protein
MNLDSNILHDINNFKMDLYAQHFLNTLSDTVNEADEPLTMGIGLNLNTGSIDNQAPEDVLTAKSQELQGLHQNRLINANQSDATIMKKMVDKIDLVSSVIGNVENDPSSLGSFLASTVSELSDAKLKRDLFNLITQQQRGIADAIEGLARIKARIQGIGAVSIGQKIADPFDSINADKKR